MPKSPQQQTNEAVADISRAHRAEELIANPLYIEAVTAMQAAMFELFNDTKLVDADERHELWQRMQLMKQFQGRFESIVKQGAKAKDTLTLLEKAKSALRRI
jgi:GTP1/Obg family GTP-binding protein